MLEVGAAARTLGPIGRRARQPRRSGSASTPRSSDTGPSRAWRAPRRSTNTALVRRLPLLTIGLPTSATAAVILTAFQSYGLQPGPELFSESGPLVWTLIASLFIGNVMLLVLNLPLAKTWARLLTIPAYGIYAGVLVFAMFVVFAAGFGRPSTSSCCVGSPARPADASGRDPGGPCGGGPHPRTAGRTALCRALTLS